MGNTPYVSIFKKIKESGISKKDSKKILIEKLKKAQHLLNSLKEEDEVMVGEAEVIDNTVNAINGLITDVIQSIGSTNEVVSTLIDTADTIENIEGETEIEEIPVEDSFEDEEEEEEDTELETEESSSDDVIEEYKF
jgi:hypothetical protein